MLVDVSVFCNIIEVSLFIAYAIGKTVDVSQIKQNSAYLEISYGKY